MWWYPLYGTSANTNKNIKSNFGCLTSGFIIYGFKYNEESLAVLPPHRKACDWLCPLIYYCFVNLLLIITQRLTTTIYPNKYLSYNRPINDSIPQQIPFLSNIYTRFFFQSWLTYCIQARNRHARLVMK